MHQPQRQRDTKHLHFLHRCSIVFSCIVQEIIMLVRNYTTLWVLPLPSSGVVFQLLFGFLFFILRCLLLFLSLRKALFNFFYYDGWDLVELMIFIVRQLSQIVFELTLQLGVNWRLMAPMPLLKWVFWLGLLVVYHRMDYEDLNEFHEINSKEP